MTLLLPFMYASRLTRRTPGKDYDPLGELKLPRWLNWPLERVLDVERMLIRVGVRLPAGGSLLLAARRAR